MRAAKNFRFGTEGVTKSGKKIPTTVDIKAGDEFPTSVEVADPENPGKTVVVEVDFEGSVQNKDGVGDIPRYLVLELAAQESPEGLTREQLMQLAGVGEYASEGSDSVEPGKSQEKTDEEEDDFREALQMHGNKGQLVTWAKEFMGMELDDAMTRVDMEDAVVDEWKSSE